MNIRTLFLVLFSGFISIVYAASWTQQDFEIFDLVAALESAEGSSVNFYSFLNISSTASTLEISRAYRKRSLELHPDKNPGVPKAHERFSRLGVIAEILKDQEKRKRYDYFYKNGVPRWRGTAYLYSRYRPGLGTVLVFLILISLFVQNVVQRLTYRTNLQRVVKVRQVAKAAAARSLSKSGGKKSAKSNNKSNADNEPVVRVQVPITALKGGPDPGPASDSDDDDRPLNSSRAARRAARAAGEDVPTGLPMITMQVQGDHVWFIDESTGQVESVDEDTLEKPTLSNTWLPRLLMARFVSRPTVSEELQDDDQTVSEIEQDSVVTQESSQVQQPNGNSKKRNRRKGGAS